ncbi:hypothetical protein E4U17_004559, partial [Claviceps sp. LM77 group G4]
MDATGIHTIFSPSPDDRLKPTCHPRHLNKIAMAHPSIFIPTGSWMSKPQREANVKAKNIGQSE